MVLSTKTSAYFTISSKLSPQENWTLFAWNAFYKEREFFYLVENVLNLDSLFERDLDRSFCTDLLRRIWIFKLLRAMNVVHFKFKATEQIRFIKKFNRDKKIIKMSIWLITYNQYLSGKYSHSSKAIQIISKLIFGHMLSKFTIQFDINCSIVSFTQKHVILIFIHFLRLFFNAFSLGIRISIISQRNIKSNSVFIRHGKFGFRIFWNFGFPEILGQIFIN